MTRPESDAVAAPGETQRRAGVGACNDATPVSARSAGADALGALGDPDALARRVAALGPAQRALFEARMGRPSRTGHGHVANALVASGITHVYGVPGQPVYDTFAACGRAGLRVIGTRHQHPAVLMATAHCYFTGAVRAAALVSAGVPAANAAAGTVVARDNGWPLLLLVGSARRLATAPGQFMALDAVALLRPLVKWAACVDGPEAIAATIAAAAAAALSGRPGPVLVELPENALEAFAPEVQAPVPGGAKPLPPGIDAGAVAAVRRRLVQARRPLLILGSGLRWSDAPGVLDSLVDGLGVPFVTSANARGMISDDHPLCVTAFTWRAQQEADFVLALGTRLNWQFRFGTAIAADATVIVVAADAGGEPPAGATVVDLAADPGAFVRELLCDVDAGDRDRARARRDPSWLAPHVRRSMVLAAREARAAVPGKPISPWQLARALRDHLPEDAITVLDGNVAMAACQRMIPARRPLSQLSPGNSGCMGVGIPFALAARLAKPDRPVVTICGDFAVGHAIIELETAVRHRVPFVVVVANNDGNGGTLRHRMHMEGIAGEPLTCYGPGVRYDLVAAALGCHAERVADEAGIGPALRRALASARPALIDVTVDPDAPYPSD
jgi:2-hydroxyacyl-CoA lyase 1